MKKYSVCSFVFISILALRAVGSGLAERNLAGMERPEENAGIAINQVGVLVYPPMMLYNAIFSGEVRAVISVDEKGVLTDCLVIGYTDQVFADAAVTALKRWIYTPARVRGRARSSRADVVFMFKDQGVIVQHLPGALAHHALAGFMEGRYVYKPCKLSELDRTPEPVHVVQPAVKKSVTEHSITVEFYIDETGRVRMPAVGQESADDAYAGAAVAAVEQWRFEPPLRKGKAVLVYAQQEFTFKPKE